MMSVTVAEVDNTVAVCNPPILDPEQQHALRLQ